MYFSVKDAVQELRGYVDTYSVNASGEARVVFEDIEGHVQDIESALRKELLAKTQCEVFAVVALIGAVCLVLGVLIFGYYYEERKCSRECPVIDLAKTAVVMEDAQTLSGILAVFSPKTWTPGDTDEFGDFWKLRKGDYVPVLSWKDQLDDLTQLRDINEPIK